MSQFRHAFSLSKREVNEAMPPGTSHLIDTRLVRTDSQDHTVQEKRIHLVPEPSADPADPLNWSLWRKIFILILISLYAILTNVQSSVLASALPNLVTAFATFHPDGPPTGLVPFSDLAHLIAVNSLMLGASAVWWVPLSHTFGRRPIILINLLVLCAASVWCGKATSFNSLLAGRVIQGCGGGAADSINAVVIGEVFFVHQRGRAMAVYTVSLVVGAPLGGLVGGYITGSLGWRWTMYIPAIISAILFVMTFFFLPETLFERQTSSNGMPESEDNAPESEENPLEKPTAYGKTAHAELASPPAGYRPFTFVRSLKIGIYRPGLLNRLWMPYLTLRLPGTWMVILHYGGLVGLIVTASTVGPQLLSAPPYLWGSSNGLFNIGGLIGGILGLAYAYLSTDWWSQRTAKREAHGYAEPETRLPLMLPSLFIATMGPLVFGLCAANPSPQGWVGLCFGLGLICFALMQVGSVGFNYILDAYGGLSGDCFLCVTLFRAVLGFVWSFVVGTWIDRDGVALVFGIFTLLMGVFSLSVLPIWIYGKRLRIATAEWVRPNFAEPE